MADFATVRRWKGLRDGGTYILGSKLEFWPWTLPEVSKRFAHDWKLSLSTSSLTLQLKIVFLAIPSRTVNNSLHRNQERVEGFSLLSRQCTKWLYDNPTDSRNFCSWYSLRIHTLFSSIRSWSDCLSRSGTVESPISLIISIRILTAIAWAMAVTACGTQVLLIVLIGTPFI